ncbi:MAG: hypothetical protein QY323_00750 [Patescibacteria group bacterium]|nr:MAG: hypothetical protein QY323_00750 [Patescibacteria group bacterium]
MRFQKILLFSATVFLLGAGCTSSTSTLVAMPGTSMGPWTVTSAEYKEDGSYTLRYRGNVSVSGRYASTPKNTSANGLCLELDDETAAAAMLPKQICTLNNEILKRFDFGLGKTGKASLTLTGYTKNHDPKGNSGGEWIEIGHVQTIERDSADSEPIGYVAVPEPGTKHGNWVVVESASDMYSRYVKWFGSAVVTGTFVHTDGFGGTVEMELKGAEAEKMPYSRFELTNVDMNRFGPVGSEGKATIVVGEMRESLVAHSEGGGPWATVTYIVDVRDMQPTSKRETH